MPPANDSAPEAPGYGTSGRIVISVDAMGGDRGPAAVIAGMDDSAAANPDVAFIVHGPEDVLSQLVARRPALAGRCTIRHAAGVVTMDDKPSQVVRHGDGTSMWSAIESVRAGEATVAVSCGNTGALMALSMIRLRKLPGVIRPAIACLWPSRNPQGFNVMLDVGADIRADAPDLLQFALMGASYARNGLGVARPRVGLLNVGTEEHKGRAELKAAQDLLAAAAGTGGFDYVGFVEGGDRGPAVVVAGMDESAAANPRAEFILHGPEEELSRLVARRPALAGRCTIRHAAGVVTMEDKPSQVVRHGEGTSMWSAIESVRAGDATVAVSCGNTGALMALSMIRLRKLPGVSRPAIACLWPSRNPQGFNVMLDVGADIRADAPDLLQFALMGASYARNGLGVTHPRVGLLNVGTEEHKGRAELKAAQDLIAAAAGAGNFD